MTLQSELQRAVCQRNAGAVVQLMFESAGPVLRQGFRTETGLWDFKRGCPRPGKAHLHAWAEVAKDALGLHNSQGGVLVFGINDDFGFCGTNERLDSKLFNDQVRRFIGDRFWIEYHREFIQADQRHLGIALIPPRGPSRAFHRGRARYGRQAPIRVCGGSSMSRWPSSPSSRRRSAEDFPTGLRLLTYATSAIALLCESCVKAAEVPSQPCSI